MARQFIDLSMAVHNDMITFPRVVRPALVMYETWQGFAERIGAAKYGVDSLTAHYLVVIGDHIGTHMDALRHLREEAPAGRKRFRWNIVTAMAYVWIFDIFPKARAFSVNDMKEALAKINYTLKPLDIVLIHTGAGRIQDSDKYLTDHVGMSGEATHWLLDQGVKMTGIDAVTYDPPIWAMFERKQFWEAHRVMLTREYYHLENLTNLDRLPPFGFTLSLFPVKWVNSTAAPVRAVAILEGD